MKWFFSPRRGRFQSGKEKPQLLLQEKQSPAFSSIPFSWRSDGQFSLGMKPAPFQQSLKQKVKKITTKHPFLPQIKRIWALVAKIQPLAHGGKGLEPRRERGEGDAAGISPDGDHGLSKLGDRLQRRVTRGTRCLVPGGPGKQADSGAFGPCLSQTLEAGAAPAPALPVWRSRGCPRPRETQDSIFSFFLPFFRKDGVRNFFFFLEGDLEGEPSGDTGLLVTVSFSLGASWSALVVVRSVPPFPRFSSALCSSSFPFTTAAGSFLAVESGGAWPPSAFLSPWEGEREQGIGAAGPALRGGFIPPKSPVGPGQEQDLASMGGERWDLILSCHRHRFPEPPPSLRDKRCGMESREEAAGKAGSNNKEGFPKGFPKGFPPSGAGVGHGDRGSPRALVPRPGWPLRTYYGARDSGITPWVTGTRGGKRKETLWTQTDRQTDTTRHHGRASSPEPRPGTRCGWEQRERGTRRGCEGQGCPLHPTEPPSHPPAIDPRPCSAPLGGHEVTASALSAATRVPPLPLLTGTQPLVLGCSSPHSPSVGSAGAGGSGGGGSGGGAPLSSAAASFSPATERNAGPRSPQCHPGLFGDFGVSLLPCRCFFLSTSCLYSSSSWSVSWLKGLGGSGSGGASS